MTHDPQDRHDLRHEALDLPEFAVPNLAEPAGAPIVLEARDGSTIILRVDEGELYEFSRSRLRADPPVTELRTVDALERLGRLRVTRLEQMRDTLQGLNLRELADRLRGSMAAAIAELERQEFAGIGAAMGVLELVQSYQTLDALARTEEYAGTADLELELRKLAGPIGAVLEVARHLGAETFEGRLEELGSALELLADVAGERGPRS